MYKLYRFIFFILNLFITILELFAISGSVDAKGAVIWQCRDGLRFQVLQPPDTTEEHPVIDVCSFATTTTITDKAFYLALLTEKMLHLYAWRTSISV